MNLAYPVARKFIKRKLNNLLNLKFKMEPRGKAIPLVSHSEREGYKITDEAKNLLCSLHGNLGVISVAGKYRTGKSYLLNHILLDLDPGQGFGVGPTINPCTKGLWVWSEPITVETTEGETIQVLLIDSEGLGAMDEDQNHDTKIFLLALLLSSYFVYNSVGTIDENAIQNLSLIVNLSKQLNLADTEDDLSSYFPSFMWILRDFALKLIDVDGNPITSKVYLENSLQPQKGMSDAIEQKNRIRRLIMHFFRDRDCSALIRPLENEKELQNLEFIDKSHLRPDFVAQVNKTRSNIFRKVKPKQVKGKSVNGEMLLSLAEAYVEAINTGNLPNIESAWSYVCKAESQKAVEEGTQNYAEFMKKSAVSFPMEPEELKTLHEQAIVEAMRSFKDKMMSEEAEEFEAALLENLKESYTRIQKENTRACNKACDTLFDKHYKVIQDQLKSNEYNNVQDFIKDFEKFTNEFTSSGPKGDAAAVKLSEFKDRVLLEAIDYISRQSSIEHTNNTRKLTEKVEMYEVELAVKREELLKEKENFQSRLSSLESERNDSKTQENIYKIRYEDMQRELTRVEDSYKERISQMKEDYKDRISDYKSRYEESKGRANDLERRATTDHTDITREKALLSQELEFKKQECDNLRANLDAQHRNLKKYKSAAEKAKDKIERIRSQPSENANPGWDSEKILLTSQINNLTKQLEDRPSTIEIKEDPLKNQVMETNKHLSSALDKIEDRCQQQEHKIDKLKRFKRMVKNAQSLTCKVCAKCIPTSAFGGHLSVCLREASRQATLEQTNTYSITIGQTMVRDSVNQKSYTEYQLNITCRNKNWSVNRPYKMFFSLHSSLQQNFPNLKLPESSNLNLKANSIFSRDRPLVLEDRRRGLEQYINDLANISQIRNSPIFQIFIGAANDLGQPAPAGLDVEFTPPGSMRYLDSSSEYDLTARRSDSPDEIQL